MLNAFTGVSVLLGNGNGTFGAGHTFAAGKFPQALVVGDFNGDPNSTSASGRATIRHSAQSTVNILLGNGNGTFGAAMTFAAGLGSNTSSYWPAPSVRWISAMSTTTTTWTWSSAALE